MCLVLDDFNDGFNSLPLLPMDTTEGYLPYMLKTQAILTSFYTKELESLALSAPWAMGMVASSPSGSTNCPCPFIFPYDLRLLQSYVREAHLDPCQVPGPCSERTQG